ncbi:MAG: YchJ family metal-binding protein [Gammaproteobacteria bacterium]|nr:YchJ family metal-binding protein [Gammaproteobacteria bacterium]
MPEKLCFCGSRKIYKECCGLLIEEDQVAETAEALMRSRYSAYVLNNENYLLKTWHSSTAPQNLNLSVEDIQWQGLNIVGTEKGQLQDTEGFVEFIATYQHEHKRLQLHERSYFVKESAGWLYVKGDIEPALKDKRTRKVGRNNPCPCGSGKKFKRCCGIN